MTSLHPPERTTQSIVQWVGVGEFVGIQGGNNVTFFPRVHCCRSLSACTAFLPIFSSFCCNNMSWVPYIIYNIVHIYMYTHLPIYWRQHECVCVNAQFFFFFCLPKGSSPSAERIIYRIVFGYIFLPFISFFFLYVCITYIICTLHTHKHIYIVHIRPRTAIQSRDYCVAAAYWAYLLLFLLLLLSSSSGSSVFMCSCGCAYNMHRACVCEIDCSQEGGVVIKFLNFAHNRTDSMARKHELTNRPRKFTDTFYTLK